MKHIPGADPELVLLNHYYEELDVSLCFACEVLYICIFALHGGGGEHFNCDRLKVLKWHQHTPESLNFTCIFVMNVPFVQKESGKFK